MAEILEREKQKLRAVLPPTLAADRIVGTADAAAFCNFSISHWRTLYRSGRVPPPIRLSERKLGWRISTLKAFVAEGGALTTT